MEETIKQYKCPNCRTVSNESDWNEMTTADFGGLINKIGTEEAIKDNSYFTCPGCDHESQMKDIKEIGSTDEPKIIIQATGQEMFEFLVCNQDTIANYFRIHSKELTYDNALEFFETHADTTYFLHEW